MQNNSWPQALDLTLEIVSPSASTVIPPALWMPSAPSGVRMWAEGIAALRLGDQLDAPRGVMRGNRSQHSVDRFRALNAAGADNVRDAIARR
jgi:hypothetical protein